METVLVQIFETVLNVEFNVVVIRKNSTCEFTLDGNGLDNFIKNLSTNIVVEYPAILAN